MKSNRRMKWTGGIRFEGVSTFGKNIATDGSQKVGGSEDGYTPTELVLFGIAGCTGIDVVRILEKQRQKLTSLEIEVTGHQKEEYPRPFHMIEIKYIAKGENLDERKLAQAIELSESKYCVVSQTIQNSGKVITSYEIQN